MADKADKAAAAEQAAAEVPVEPSADPALVPDPEAPGAALVAPAELPNGGAGAAEPEVASERGSVVLRLADWSLTAFEMTLDDGGDDPRPITVTRDGLRVTKAQCEEIQACARAHGVELTEETA